MTTRTVLLSGVAASAEARLRSALPGVRMQLLPCPIGRDAVRGVVDAAAAVLSLETDAESVFRAARDLAAAGVRVVIIGPNKDADLILRAMREGAKAFVLAGDDSELEQELMQLVRPGADGALVCTVFAAKGGTGSTTIATNLAGALRGDGERTCLVDLNLEMGDVMAFLDLTGGCALSDVIANLRRIDRQLLDTSIVTHASGIQVLAQSHRTDEVERVDAPSLASVLDVLRQHYRSIVLDAVCRFDDLSVAAFDASDRIVLLVTQEVPAVRAARRCVELFKRLGAEAKLRVVINRFQKNVDIGTEVISETLGLPVTATIANDYRAVVGAVNRGVLLREEAPRSQVTRDVEDLAAMLRGAPMAPPVRERPSFLQRFLPLRTSHATE